MAQIVEKMGGMRAAVAAGLAGVIGLAGIAVAVTLASCEASSRSARVSAAEGSRTAHQSVAHAELPKVDPGVDTHAGPNGAPSVGPANSAIAQARVEPQMRVRILASAETLRVAGTEGVVIGQGEPRGTTTLSPGAKTEKRTNISVALKGGQWTVSELTAQGTPGGPPVMYPATMSLVLMPPAAGQMLSVNGTPYPGVLRLSARTDVRPGAFDVVDFVGIEEYLPGVVGKEMLPGWPLAAYQAQAVAARSYAIHERQRVGTGSSFDVECNDRDQVYGGATTNLAAREAVRTTRGMVLMDSDRVLRSYYSSTCGGRTAAAHDTWPTGPGFEYNLALPIQEHHRDFACTGSPLFRWSVDRPRWELVQRLKWFGERNGFPVKKIRDVRAIEIAGVNSEGRPSRYRIVEPNGTVYQLSAEEMRLACNTNANGSVASVPPPRGGDGAALAGADPAPPLLPGVAPTVGLPILGFGMANEGAPAGAAGAAMGGAAIPDIDRRTRVHSSDFEVMVRGDKVSNTGRGFGHGVGLCQYCAKAFAERGEDWRTMLERFYPGARITSMY